MLLNVFPLTIAARQSRSILRQSGDEAHTDPHPGRVGVQDAGPCRAEVEGVAVKYGSERGYYRHVPKARDGRLIPALALSCCSFRGTPV